MLSTETNLSRTHQAVIAHVEELGASSLRPEGAEHGQRPNGRKTGLLEELSDPGLLGALRTLEDPTWRQEVGRAGRLDQQESPVAFRPHESPDWEGRDVREGSRVYIRHCCVLLEVVMSSPRRAITNACGVDS